MNKAGTISKVYREIIKYAIYAQYTQYTQYTPPYISYAIEQIVFNICFAFVIK